MELQEHEPELSKRVKALRLAALHHAVLFFNKMGDTMEKQAAAVLEEAKARVVPGSVGSVSRCFGIFGSGFGFGPVPCCGLVPVWECPLPGGG